MFASSASGGGQRGLSGSFAALDGDGTLLAQQMPKNGDLARLIQWAITEVALCEEKVG